MADVWANVVTGLATIGGVTVTLWSTSRRERRARNHAERTKMAGDYFLAYNAYRRALRSGLENEISQAGRALADISVLMEIYFDISTVRTIEQARQELNKKYHRDDPSPPGDPGLAMRERVLKEVQRQIEPIQTTNLLRRAHLKVHRKR